MPIPSRHGHAMVVAEQFVDGDGVVERRPAFRQVGGAARDQKRARGHQRVRFHQIMSAFDQRPVGAGAWLAFGGEFAKGTGAFWIGDDPQLLNLKSEIDRTSLPQLLRKRGEHIAFNSACPGVVWTMSSSSNHLLFDLLL